MRQFIALALLCLVTAFAVPVARANPYADMVRAEVLPGWRMPDGQHVAALRLVLADGWKTYWRAPGDAGIPPLFDWSGSGNLGAVTPVWPTPVVFWQNGMRSIGYKRELILPLKIAPQRAGRAVDLQAHVQLGICQDVCVPVDLRVSASLPDAGRPDPRIVAAMTDVPVSGAEAGVKWADCAVSPIQDGLRLTARVALPRAGEATALVVETADPQVWVAEPELSHKGGVLTAQTRLMHMNGGAFALDRSGLRLTVLGTGQAVDIRGCPAP
ncbi:protein-disulfide reductase DsbD domain-containing protein [Lacimonas salitolerans]|uniref:Protein-disulfide reductase DsbD domain-containing protein n=1 Tax=Lacimonas salitolerans TaxID=1323750 RepID=A0ABW4EGT1_9RHOB